MMFHPSLSRMSYTRCSENFIDIGSALQIVIMVGYDDAILATLQIRLQIIDSHLASPPSGTLGFFWCPIGRTTMSYHGIQGYIVANHSHLLTDGLDICCYRFVIVGRAGLYPQKRLSAATTSSMSVFSKAPLTDREDDWRTNIWQRDTDKQPCHILPSQHR